MCTVRPSLVRVLCSASLGFTPHPVAGSRVLASKKVSMELLPLPVGNAAKEGDVHGVATWLYGGGGVDARCAERDDMTLVMAAAEGGQKAVVRMLLQRGASVDLQSSCGVTALMEAATSGHITIVQVLLNAKADASLRTDAGYTALMMAEEFKRTATAQVLRQHAKRQAAEKGLPDAMFLAAHEGGAKAVTAWLDEGGGVDAHCADGSDRTLLIRAAGGGQEAVVWILLQRGASVDLQDSYGATALTETAANGHTTIVQVLLDAKADYLLKTVQGRTALMWAEHNKHTATAQLLRQHAKRQTAEEAANLQEILKPPP